MQGEATVAKARSSAHSGSRVLYGITRAIMWLLAKGLYRVKMTGRDRIPASGPVIIAANHSSYIDPVLVGLTCRRPIHYMAKAELFKMRGLSWCIRKLNAFPVRRGVADRAAMRTALGLLAEGEVVLLFAEGTRYRLDGLGPIQAGAGVIAEKAHCPIVPVTLVGTDRVMPQGARLPRFPKLAVIVGEPLMPDREAASAREAKRRGMALIQRAMADVERAKRAARGRGDADAGQAVEN